LSDAKKLPINFKTKIGFSTNPNFQV